MSDEKMRKGGGVGFGTPSGVKATPTKKAKVLKNLTLSASRGELIDTETGHRFKRERD